MAVAFTWRHTSRRDVEIALYVALRMVHVPGYTRIAVLCEPDGHTWCVVEISPTASEEDARDWSKLLERRYRVDVTLDELLVEPARFSEIYIDGGIAVFLERYIEAERVRRELQRRNRESL